MKKLIFLITIAFMSTFTHAETMTLYKQKLEKLKRDGVINESEATEQLKTLSLDGEKGHNKFKNQVRGVASTIKEPKIYKIENEPIEIP